MKECINPGCKKQIPDDSKFCGFCASRQDGMAHPTPGGSQAVKKEAIADSSDMFYADDYEVVKQFDPLVIPTKDQVTFENLLTTFQETVKNKDYPFIVQSKEHRWRADASTSKQRIVIQATHDAKWEKILFPISVEQLGNDTTVKLSVLRKNEIAEFYYSTLESLGMFSGRTSSDSIEYKTNWNDDRKYLPVVERAIRHFAERVEKELVRLPPEKILESPKIQPSMKLFLRDLFGRSRIDSYYQDSIDGLQTKENILQDAKNVENTRLAEIVKAIGNVHNTINEKEKKVHGIIGANGFIIAVSVVGAIVLALAVNWQFIIYGLPIYGILMLVRFVLKSSSEGTLNSLREHLNTLDSERSAINNDIYSMRNRATEVDNALLANRNDVVNAIINMKTSEFQSAETNETKWRTPSFVDEELEQLLSLVRNVFNEITGKITRKKTGKGLTLQTAMGLGGMGFDD